MKSSLSIFHFVTWAFSIISKIPLCPWSSVTMIESCVFSLELYSLSSHIHVFDPFWHDERWGSNFVPFHVAMQLTCTSKEDLSSAILLCSQSSQPLAGPVEKNSCVLIWAEMGDLLAVSAVGAEWEYRYMCCSAQCYGRLSLPPTFLSLTFSEGTDLSCGWGVTQVPISWPLLHRMWACTSCCGAVCMCTSAWSTRRKTCACLWYSPGS